CTLSVANLRDVPKQIASLFREGKIVSPEDAENELTKLLTSEGDAILLALDPLSETAARVKEIGVRNTVRSYPLFLIRQNMTIIACARFRNCYASSPQSQETHQVVARTQIPCFGKKILPARTPLTFNNFDNRETCILQGTSTTAQSEAQSTPMETEHGENEHDRFREAFRLLNAKDHTTEAGLPPIEFDAVNAAKGRLLSQQDDSPEFARLKRWQAAMALPEVKNISDPDGKGFTEFVMSFSMKYGRIGLPDDILIHLMSEKLEGHPKAVMKTLPEETRKGKFADFVVALNTKFAENTSARRMESHVKLKQLKMARSVTEYCVQLESLRAQRIPRLPKPICPW
ncbi:hypothetical protein OSTOST_06932, partial [Ostertagia ostertagi]